MNLIKKIGYKRVFISYDFISSILLTIFIVYLVGDKVGNGLAKDLYAIGISVLSIVFAVFFAALTIITSTGNDDFINFLENEDGFYTLIINVFGFSLIILFIALVYSIVLYGLTSYWLVKESTEQNKLWFTLYTFLFSWGLFSSLGSIMDALKFAKLRSKFYVKINENDN